MAIASTSCEIQDQTPTHAKQMLHDRLSNDSPFFSSRCFADFDHDPQSSSSPLVLAEHFQQQFAGAGNASDLEKRIHPESIALSSAASAISREIGHIMQGRVGSYPVSQHLSIGHESIGRGSSGDFGSLGFNELADFWGDIRLYSQEMATATVLPPHRHGWVGGPTSCTTSGDLMTTTAPVEFDRPPGQPSYTIPTCSETSAGEVYDLECPRPLQADQSSHSPRPVAKSVTSVGLNPPLIYYGPSRTSTSDAVLSLSSNCQPEIPDKIMSLSLQPSTSRKSIFQSQSLARDRVKDGAVVEHLSDTVNDSKVLGPRQHNFVQEAPCLSMSRSPDLHKGRQPGECGTGGKAYQYTTATPNHLKLKQKPLAKPAPRKYQRRRSLHGIDVKHYMEVDSVPTPLDHVQRERQRRDIMTSKIAALELLLPKSSKRDRVSVVYDAIQLLKRLEREVKDLQQRFHEAKLRRAGRKQSRGPGRFSIPKSIDYNMGKKGSYFSNGIVIKRTGTHMKPVVAVRTQHTRGSIENSRPTQLSSMITSTQCLGGSNILDKGDVFVEFHVHLDDTVSVQEERLLKCRCRMNYLSTMISVVDEFQLDVISCNIIKLSGYFMCVTGLKTRTRAETTTAAQVAVRLQSVVDVDIASQALTTTPSGAKTSESIEH